MNSLTPSARRSQPWALAALVAALATPSIAAPIAQGDPCPTLPVRTAFVDSYYGDDAIAQVGLSELPFGTIQRAIDQVAADPAVTSGTAVGVVQLRPGIYTSTPSQSPLFDPGGTGGNEEDFPIRMRSGIVVQGMGAKECVIRFQRGDDTVPHFIPRASEGCEGPMPVEAVGVIFDFSRSNNAVLDGVTLQGGDVQVLMEAETNRSGRVSNCVFDLRDREEHASASFGVLVSAIWDRPIEGYADVGMEVFNNTFVQGVKFGPNLEDASLSSPSSVAICDVNVPAPTGSITFPDADRILAWRGVNDLHIQNNLIRTLDEESSIGVARTAMLGVDFGDTAVDLGLEFDVPTNAFGAGLALESSVDGTFCSAIVGDPPVPAVDTLVQDPAFFGEMNADRRGTASMDLRLLPSSSLVNAGVAPQPTEDPCVLELVASNGRVHTQEATPADTLHVAGSSFDFDGEVYGNPRIFGEGIDIGFDEVDLLLIGGSYGDDTKSHHLPWDSTLPELPPAGVPERVMITQDASPYAYQMVFSEMLQVSGVSVPFFTKLPPLITPAPPLAFTANFPGVLDPPNLIFPAAPIWVDLANVDSSPSIQAPAAINVTPISITWTNWIDGSAHTFGELQVDLDDTTTTIDPSFLSGQIFYLLPDGTLLSSNLQAEYL